MEVAAMVRKPEQELPASEINSNLRQSLLPRIKNVRGAGAETEGTGADDLIGRLSGARENRRARQVFEWEKTRRFMERDSA